jgi:hypothetical protein
VDLFFLQETIQKLNFVFLFFHFFLEKNQDGFTARCPQWFHSLQFGSFETETEKFENLPGKFGPEPGPRPADPDVVDQRVGGADANQKSKTCGLNQGILKGKYHCTIDLLFDRFELVCFANKNKKYQ